MRTEFYKAEKHLKMLKEWHADHKVGKFLWETLPQLGLIGYEGDTPLACVFLRVCEGGVVIIDHVMSNPSMGKGTVRDAITHMCLLAKSLAEKSLEAKVVLAWTAVPWIKERCLQNGFLEMPYTLLATESI